MEFLGIGPEELIFILIILFLILGPKDLVKLGTTLGRSLRNIRESAAWRSINEATRQLRELPENLARQAGVDELKEIGKELGGELKDQHEELDRQFVAWTRKSKPPWQKTAAPPKPESGPEDSK